mgnify:CR=1 FL=1
MAALAMSGAAPTGTTVRAPGLVGPSDLPAPSPAPVMQGPRSGRVLGLISLAEIPRRLSLDFSDFFEKGFGFNTMQGEFVFADGRASTDLLQINGPAAEIRVSGSTDLRAQQYDQRIEVLPKAGGVLPAIGAIAGGPVGAAVGAVAQAVLQKPLKQAARTVYRVTGPWKEPVIEVMERGAAGDGG